MAKLPQLTRTCLVNEHCLSSALNRLARDCRFSFLRNAKFVAAASSPALSARSRSFQLCGFPISFFSFLAMFSSLRGPLPGCCGHPELGISLPTPTTDSPSCQEARQLSTFSCQPSVGMPSTTRRIPHPRSCPSPAQHTIGLRSFIRRGQLWSSPPRPGLL